MFDISIQCVITDTASLPVVGVCGRQLNVDMTAARLHVTSRHVGLSPLRARPCSQRLVSSYLTIFSIHHSAPAFSDQH